MKSKQPFIFLLLIVLHSSFPLSSYAQKSRALVQQSLAAYGNWDQVTTLNYSVTGNRDGGAQGKEYKSGERQAYRSTRTYHLPKKLLYETNLNTFPGGYAFHFTTIVQDTMAYNYDIDGTRGGKVYNQAGKAVSESRWKVVNNHIAYYKVLELSQTTDSLLLLPDTTQHLVIRRLNGKDAPVGDYYFSRKSNLLEQVTTSQGIQQLVLEFGNYTQTGGRMDNGLVKLSANGKNSYEETVKVNKVNFAFDTNLLALPKGYVLNKTGGPSKPMQIAKDIYLIERLAGDRNVLFVNMDEYITVIEAPISSDLSKQVLQMIREVAPQKPIKYVFTTHYHSDHTGGLRQYAYEGAQLLMTAPTQAYVRDLLATTLPDDFGKSGRTNASMVFIEGKYVLQDANHLVEFYEVPNAHCNGMALAYFPNEKLVYQGDLLSVPLDGTLPNAIEVTQDMQRFLVQKGLPYDRIIGHHGHNQITPAMVQKILKRSPTTVKALLTK